MVVPVGGLLMGSKLTGPEAPCVLEFAQERMRFVYEELFEGSFIEIDRSTRSRERACTSSTALLCNGKERNGDKARKCRCGGML